MPELVAIELEAHIPAPNFEISRQFYQNIGFTLCPAAVGCEQLSVDVIGESICVVYG